MLLDFEIMAGGVKNWDQISHNFTPVKIRWEIDDMFQSILRVQLGTKPLI